MTAETTSTPENFLTTQPHAIVERTELLFRVGVVEAEHRFEMLDLGKAGGHPAADTLRR